jgi:hypothetical protein
MKRLPILVLCILLRHVSIFAQPPTLMLASNEMKYWKLRGRRTGDDTNYTP